jgi:LysR family transcriptional regulator, cell division regulator
MDAADLKFFEEVAQSGGMSRAAKKLNTVQSNVTRRIRMLESELNVSLFNRTGRGVSLTPAGEQLLPFAIRIARLIDEAARAISDDGRPKGSLVIGSLETTAALRLTPFLSQFVADFPEVDFSLKTGTSRELVEDVLEHRLEGAFVCGPIHHPDLLQRKMYQERLVVLTARRETSLSAYLRKNDLRMVVLRAGCSYRLILESWLAHRGIVGVRILEFGTLEAIIGCVEAGLGMTLLPEALVGPVWRNERVAVHPLPNDYGHVDTLFIRRRDSFQSSALKALLALASPQFARRQTAKPRPSLPKRDFAKVQTI